MNPLLLEAILREKLWERHRALEHRHQDQYYHQHPKAASDGSRVAIVEMLVRIHERFMQRIL